MQFERFMFYVCLCVSVREAFNRYFSNNNKKKVRIHQAVDAALNYFFSSLLIFQVQRSSLATFTIQGAVLPCLPSNNIHSGAGGHYTDPLRGWRRPAATEIFATVSFWRWVCGQRANFTAIKNKVLHWKWNAWWLTFVINLTISQHLGRKCDRVNRVQIALPTLQVPHFWAVFEPACH